MKKINIYYFCIIFILILTNYINKIFKNKVELSILKEIKIVNIILLIIFTIILTLLKKENLKLNIKYIIFLLIFTIFLRKFYLSFFIIVISNFIDRKTRLKQLLFILCLFYFTVLVLNSFDFLDFNNIKYGIRRFESFEIYRHALGFSHPNTAMALLFPIFSLLYYLYYPKYKKTIIGIILIIGSIIFGLTFSRTTFLLLILFIILVLIKDKYIEKFKFLFLTEGFFMILFTFYLPFYFRNTILNKFFSGRLRLFHYYLTNHKVTLFGYSEIKKMYDTYPLDNIYLRCLFENGIIGFIVLIILVSIIMYILVKNKDYKAVRIFSIILIFGFMESIALFYYFNIVYFIISDYIFRKEKNEIN